MSSTNRRTEAKPREDPWPEMEAQMNQAVTNVFLTQQKVSATPSSPAGAAAGGGVSSSTAAAAASSSPSITLVMEQELRDHLSVCDELLEDLHMAIDSVERHPELFTMTTEEFQRRKDVVLAWERELVKPNQFLKRQETLRRQRAAGTVMGGANGAEGGMSAQQRRSMENGEYLHQEHEAQQGMMKEQDEVIDRLHAGVTRVKANAVVINEELSKQDRMLNELDKDMTAVQNKLEGAISRVGKLLDAADDKKKFICIFVLLVVLGVLVMLLFN